MINHAFRCIYIHIPKTAGNSINRTFNIDWENHKDLQRYSTEIAPGLFSAYYKFAVVRNPWDRLLSDYNYQKKKSRPRQTRLFLYKENGAQRNFREWVRAVLDDPNQYDPSSWGADVTPGIHRWSPQLDWLSIGGRLAVDRILRMESLSSDFADVCTRLGKPVPRLPRRNRRMHFHYSWYYDDTTRELVRAYYVKDIEMFGYRFESAAERFRKWTRVRALILSLPAGFRAYGDRALTANSSTTTV